MPIEIIRDSIDDVEEPEKAFFESTADGKHRFSWSKYTEAQKAGLVKKNKELLAATAAHKAAMARFDPFKDLDDDGVTEVVAWIEAGKPKGGSKPEEIDALKTQIAKTFEKQIAKISGEKGEVAKQLEAASKEIRHFKLAVPVRDAALKAGVLADDIDLVMMDTAKNFGLDDDGKVVVLDADGDPTETSLKEFFEKLYKQQRPKFYAATGAGGSGAGHNTSGGAGGRADLSRLSPSERLKAARELGIKQ